MMWARVCELVLAAWLAASPLWFERAGWLEVGFAAAIVALAGTALARPQSRVHLWELAAAGVMAGLGWLQTREGLVTPASQNLIVVGLLLATFAIVPTRAAAPPEAWREP